MGFNLGKGETKPTAASILVIIGGLIIIYTSIFFATDLPNSDFNRVVGIISGIILVVSPIWILSNNTNRIRAGSGIAVISSFASWAVIGGLFIGFMLSLVGGLLGLFYATSKRKYYNRVVPYAVTLAIISSIILALFSLGCFGCGTRLPYECVALSESGYYCQNPIYKVSTGNLTATIGQNTGKTWISANVEYIPESVVSNVISCGFSINGNTNCLIPAANETEISGGLVSGQTIRISIPVSLASSTKLGQVIQGQIWVQYQTSIGGSYSYVEIATVNLQAV